jgi:outer membrane murein-binding lipoprotein Lpp
MVRRLILVAAIVPIHLCGCASPPMTSSANKLAHDQFPQAQAELREAVEAIRDDIIATNIEGLQAAHLASNKFTKFGPRRFERQDVAGTNESEAAFFSSISNVSYNVEDLKNRHLR